MNRRLLLALCALFAALLAGERSAPAQFGFADDGPVTVSAAPEFTEVRPGDQLAIALVMTFESGWHAWPAKEQGIFGPDVEMYHTQVGLTETPAWVEVVGTTQWPETHLEMGPDPVTFQTAELQLYSGVAITYLPVKIASDAAPGEVSLSVDYAYQTCDATMCMQPVEDAIEVSLTIVPSDAPVPTPNQASLFVGYERGPIVAAGDSGDPDDTGTVADDADVWVIPLGVGGKELRVGRNVFGLAIVAGLGALGGFLLNLTPCVLPVIPIKIIGLTQSAGSSRGRTFFLGVMMFAGIIAFWVAIGAALSFLGSFNAPSQLFASWQFTVAIALFILVMGLGMFGLFEVGLPKQIYAINPSMKSPHGSFFFGVMTAVLGLPCFAPLMGGVTAFATKLSAGFTLAVFFSIGAGMALPYLILAANPKLVSFVPKTGPASVLVKQVMGFFLLAAGAFFMGTGLSALLAEQPYLAKALHWWVAALFIIAGCVWMVVKTIKITPSAGKRVGFGLLGALIAFCGWYAASAFTTVQRDAYAEQVANQDDTSGGGGLWAEYTPARFEAAIDEGKVVVLDFTADWCLICKTLKIQVLSKPSVKEALKADDVASFTVDLTSRKAIGWAKLEELGEKGIPLLAIYGPGVDEPIKSNAYTTEQVLGWIETARGGTTGLATNQ